jgi:hypothetical protein
MKEGEYGGSPIGGREDLSTARNRCAVASEAQRLFLCTARYEHPRGGTLLIFYTPKTTSGTNGLLRIKTPGRNKDRERESDRESGFHLLIISPNFFASS